MNYGNNHTHLHKYNGKWYLFYQANNLEASIGSNGGFRSIYVDEIEVDEENAVIYECIPTFKGVSAIKDLDPYTVQYAATSAATLGIVYEKAEGEGHMVAKAGTPSTIAPVPSQGIIEVRNANFSGDVSSLTCIMKGNGSVSVRLDDKDGADIALINSTGDGWEEVTTECFSTPTGKHNIYLILKGEVELDKWVFGEDAQSGIGSVSNDSGEMTNDNIYDLQGRRHSSATQRTRGIYITNGKKYLSK